MPKRIATWNRARGAWERDRIVLLCEHLEPFSETWPTSGTTRNGVACGLPTWAPRMAAIASSSLLPTPDAYAGERGGARDPQERRDGHHSINLQDQVSVLRVRDLEPVQTLPTPLTSDAPGGHSNVQERTELGQPLSLADALNQGVLPTPQARDYKDTGNFTAHPEKSKLAHTVKDMQDQAAEQIRQERQPEPRKLPTPDAGLFNDAETREHWEARQQKWLERGKKIGPTLGNARHLLPTPKATDEHHSSPADLNRNEPPLRAVAKNLLPTPLTSDADKGGPTRPADRRCRTWRRTCCRHRGHRTGSRGTRRCGRGRRVSRRTWRTP